MYLCTKYSNTSLRKYEENLNYYLNYDKKIMLKTQDFKLSTILESGTKMFNKLVQWLVIPYSHRLIYFMEGKNK